MRFTPEDLADRLGQFQPTEQQSAIISAPLEPMLVIAGAGSGKTATMADRVVWLVANGFVRPDEVLGVTFTRKAAGELAHRIRIQLMRLAEHGLIDGELDELGEPSVSTYHAYANSLVADHGMRIGIEPDAELLGSAQTWQLADRIVQEYDGDPAELQAARSTLTDAVVHFASECAEHLIAPGEAAAHLEAETARLDALPYLAGKEKDRAQAAEKIIGMLRTRAAVARLAERYAAAKRERSVLDYGDLVAFAARIARDVPAAREEERSRFKVVLLDEFQDTSHAQMVLFSSLFGDGHAVTAVGDPNQSIYGFRGASAGQLFRFPQEFPRVTESGREPAVAAHLTTAWRNSVNILEAANAVSAPLVRESERGGSIGVEPLVPSPVAGAGRVELARLPTSGEEMRWLGRRLQEARESALRETGTLPTAAVLFRRREELAEMAAALDELGMDYEIVGLSGLLALPEIVDMVATLRILVDPNRSDALLRLLAGARWRLGPADLLAFSEWAQALAWRRQRALAAPAPNPETSTESESDAAGPSAPPQEITDMASLVEALDELPPPGWTSRSGRSLTVAARERLGRFQQEVRYLRTFVDDDLLALLNEVERTLGLDIELAAKPGQDIHAARRSLDAFADVAATYRSTAAGTSLTGFLAWLDAAAEQEGGLPIPQGDTGSRAVQLLTIHASKGLEWDVVAVAGLNDSVFPTARDNRWSSGHQALPWPLRGDRHDLPQWDLDQPDLKSVLEAEKEFKGLVAAHVELEERRLAYVALTRARHLLIATCSVWCGSRSKPVGVSPFMQDLLPLTEGPTPRAVPSIWCADEDAPTENPYREEPLEAVWPFDPLEGPHVTRGGVELAPPPSRRPALEGAAARVRETAVALRAAAAGRTGAAATEVEHDEAAQRIATEEGRAWLAEAELLLKRQQRTAAPKEYELPRHVRASLFVDLASERQAVLAQLRRPVPRRPGLAARKGTAFHAWVEERFGSSGMLDMEEWTTAADTHIDDAYDLEDMKAAFLASEWADRQPVEVEVPFETNIGPVNVRGRIDAVFAERRPDGELHWTLVDWKTGRVPTGREAEAKAIQLAVYRLGWARLHGLDVDRVDAAFFYVTQGRTLRPPRLASEGELEELIASAFPD